MDLEFERGGGELVVLVVQQKMWIYASAFMLLINQLAGAAQERTTKSHQHVQHDFSKMESITEASHK